MLPKFPIPLAESIPGGWRPGIGDPTVAGWVTVAAYFAAAVACWYASRAERHLDPAERAGHPIFWKPGLGRPDRSASRISAGRRVLFWRLLAAGMVVLGINKQLDLQTLLPVIGRQVAREQGWYENRQDVQRAFIFAIGVLGLGALAVVGVLFRSVAVRRPLAPIGLVCLYFFVLVRASSFHHVDVLLKESLLGIRINLLLELGGISLVLVAALRCLAEARRVGRP